MPPPCDEIEAQLSTVQTDIAQAEDERKRLERDRPTVVALPATVQAQLDAILKNTDAKTILQHMNQIKEEVIAASTDSTEVMVGAIGSLEVHLHSIRNTPK